MERRGRQNIRKRSIEQQEQQEQNKEKSKTPSADTLRRMRITSKTTYKLNDKDDDKAEGSNGVELMEIPLSPTNYDQPPPPFDLPPPSAEVAEREIFRVIDGLRSVSLAIVKTI